ncbi:MAG TPA: VIT domain-containing protein [Anaerolineae bacterium]|nr:VIT domain-containing protein [Anaerolineae bacterium]HQI86731.1 VIT domain-containing protein [Anaerolineae bacterium]
MKKHIAVLVALFAALVTVMPVLADGIIIIDPPVVPTPDWRPWLTIRYHRVTVKIEDQVAITKVDQVFRNDGKVAAEGTYVFPLPPGAVVQSFVMWVDGKPVEGEILPADKARDIYESYVQRQRDPALLEYIGRDAVRARIFPIPAGEERRVQLEYTQVLPVADDMMFYRYPLNTERFSALPLEQVSISVSLTSKTPLRAIYSPSHQNEVLITREGAHRATISYEANHVLPERDFELYVGISSKDIGANLLTYQTGNEDGFFVLMLTPALADEVQHVLPKDIILVLDTSGSMDGEKLMQAQDALAYILKHLNAEDRFNVIAFSSGVRTYAAILQASHQADSAMDWVYNLEALGGTNIYLALSEALAQASGERPTTIIFLTDGLATEGIVDDQTLLSSLAQEAPASVRIFPFGVGYDVNTLFLDQLAQDHKGVPAYVKPEERIDENVSAFYARIQSPMLTNVSLDFGAVQIYDMYPMPLPDLYAGTQLIVTGRYSGEGLQHITLAGEVEGQRSTHRYEGNFQANKSKDFIPRLWAARKIGYLLTQIRLHGENVEWINAVVALSLRYGIITPYTSFLVEEPTETLTTEGRDRATEEFAQSLQAAPTAVSGASAVEDAEMRKGLGNAEAPPAAGEMLPSSTGGDAEKELSSIRYVGDKTFLCQNTVCTDTTYIPDQMTPQEVPFMSETYWKLTETQPELAAYFAVGEETFFVADDGKAYHFRLGEETEVITRPDLMTTTETPPAATPTTPPATNQAPSATGNRNAPGACSAAALAAIGAVSGLRGKRRKIRSDFK